MKSTRSWQILLANVAWLLACLPGALLFLIAAVFPELAQRARLRRILRLARNSRFGRRHGFSQILQGSRAFGELPLADFETFRPWIDSIQKGESDLLTGEPVRILQPTSGTSAARKLIPLTSELEREFQAGLAPWIASLYLLRPTLLLGRQYWCLSPNTRAAKDTVSAVPVGFADDTEYLGVWQRWCARSLLVAPSALAGVEDPATFEFLTLLFLVREERLSLISVWHPSFLTLLLDALPKHARCLAACIERGTLPGHLTLDSKLRPVFESELRPDPRRARLVEQCSAPGSQILRTLWPRLKIISCWAGISEQPWLSRLRAAFPNVAIQPKGLLATEGIVSIPLGFSGRHVCAVRSHFYEFSEEAAHLTNHCCDLEEGRRYTVVISTGGGLYRYQLGDRVRVSGFFARTPCLEFLGRAGVVSDICGEKLSLNDAEAAVRDLQERTGVSFEFAMLVPSGECHSPGYTLIFQLAAGTREFVPQDCRAVMEESLQANFHYRHARRLGQLRGLDLLEVDNAVASYRSRLVESGLRQGDMKFPALRKETDWVRFFKKASARELISLEKRSETESCGRAKAAKPAKKK